MDLRVINFNLQANLVNLGLGLIEEHFIIIIIIGRGEIFVNLVSNGFLHYGLIMTLHLKILNLNIFLCQLSIQSSYIMGQNILLK